MSEVDNAKYINAKNIATNTFVKGKWYVCVESFGNFEKDKYYRSNADGWITDDNGSYSKRIKFFDKDFC